MVIITQYADKKLTKAHIHTISKYFLSDRMQLPRNAFYRDAIIPKKARGSKEPGAYL